MTSLSNIRSTGATPLRIAVASSGLGHVCRGIETWAADLAAALRGTGQDITLFQGGGAPAAEWQQVLPCKRRFEPDAERWVAHMQRFGGWRFGCGSGYEVEQTTFALRLWARTRRAFDILHVQDPWVARLMERMHRAGLSRPRVILAHGTEERAEALQTFSHLQHLAPCYMTQSGTRRPAGQSVYAIPNFVDVDTFRPGDRDRARSRWGLPPDTLVVLSVAAIKKQHKRADALIREFARFADAQETPSLLVIAGAREVETDEVMRLGRSLLGPRVRFLEGVGRDQMPSLYQAADVFALASLHEMMPIAMLEALASGLPVACNDTDTMRWMVGEAGAPEDISQEGALAAQLERLADPVVRLERGRAARRRAEDTFSTERVVAQIIAMYRDVKECRGMTTPEISVVIPAFNAEGTVGRAIESALAQTLPVQEILVVDDGSTDRTADVVAVYPSPVRLLRQENGGPAAARNRAAREAAGGWLALLDADDSWLPRKLERQAALTADPTVAVVHCFADGSAARDGVPDRVTFSHLWERNCVDNSSVLLRKAAFEQVGGFDEDRALISVEDYNLWLRLAGAGWGIATCPERLWRYTPAPGSLSSQTERFARAEIANVDALAGRLHLDPALAQRKRLRIQEEYGRCLFYERRMGTARAHLFLLLRLQPSLRRFGWWLATFAPTAALDWRRSHMGRLRPKRTC